MKEAKKATVLSAEESKKLNAGEIKPNVKMDAKAEVEGEGIWVICPVCGTTSWATFRFGTCPGCGTTLINW